MEFTSKHKDSWGAWTSSVVPVLSVGNPRNVRGRVTGSNWAVDYETPSLLGNTGKRTGTQYFCKKTDAIEWISNL